MKSHRHKDLLSLNENGNSAVIADLLQSLSDAVAGGAKPMHIQLPPVNNLSGGLSNSVDDFVDS